MNATRPTGRTDEGFALIYMAVLMTCLLLFAGLALDVGRAYVVKAQLTKGVDGAALGAARMLNSGNPKGQAERIFKMNFPLGFYATLNDPTAAGDFYSSVTDEASGVNVVTIRATTRMPTTLMKLGLADDVTVTSEAEATRRMVDLCLVLDASGSIGGRWGAVRDAARAFIEAFDEVNDRFCLVQYSSGANVLQQIRSTRGFNKSALVNAVPNSLPGGYTAMAEGLYRGWDELRTVPVGTQSSLRIIVLFTDGAANSVPGIYDISPGSAKSLATSDFPKNQPDPDGMTSNTPSFAGLFHAQSGSQSPSYNMNVAWDSTTTHANVRLLPATSTHGYGRSAGIPTTFELQSGTLRVNGSIQSAVRGLRNRDAATGRYPADVWNTNNAGRNLVEIIADAARSDLTGAHRIRIYTIGMGELLQYNLGTIPEKPEDILKRVANDISSLDFNSAHIEGKHYFARTQADVGAAFWELQNQIIRLTR
jgi:Flp pilus assembly protein TadG